MIPRLLGGVLGLLFAVILAGTWGHISRLMPQNVVPAAVMIEPTSNIRRGSLTIADRPSTQASWRLTAPRNTALTWSLQVSDQGNILGNAQLLVSFAWLKLVAENQTIRLPPDLDLTGQLTVETAQLQIHPTREWPIGSGQTQATLRQASFDGTQLGIIRINGTGQSDGTWFFDINSQDDPVQGIAQILFDPATDKIEVSMRITDTPALPATWRRLLSTIGNDLTGQFTLPLSSTLILGR